MEKKEKMSCHDARETLTDLYVWFECDGRREVMPDWQKILDALDVALNLLAVMEVPKEIVVKVKQSKEK